MLKLILRSSVATFSLAILLCCIYPLLVTAIGHVLFPEKTNGGLIQLEDGRAVGAKLIGQSFNQPYYFHGRPSFAGTGAGTGPGSGYDASNSSGSNLGPTNQKLADSIHSNVDRILKENSDVRKGQIPVDIVTASASGLDPHISPDAADIQVERVARSRNVDSKQIRSLVKEHVEGPQLALLGEPVVNVLLLNVDLDDLYPIGPRTKELGSK